MLRPAWLSVLIALALAGCQAELASGLEEGAADEVVLALDEAGIGAEKVRDDASGEARFAVRVPESELVTAMATLRDRDLPRVRPPGLAEVLEGGGLVPSAGEERARLAAATGAELARSLEEIDGVERARVHLALPDPGARLLDDDAPSGSRASVLLTTGDEAGVSDDAVRALVAGAVTDLAAEDVAVVRSSRRPRTTREAALTRVGPIAVSRGSASLLRGILGASFALNMLLAGGLIWSRRRAASPPSGTPAAGLERS